MFRVDMKQKGKAMEMDKAASTKGKVSTLVGFSCCDKTPQAAFEVEGCVSVYSNGTKKQQLEQCL